MSEEVGFTNQLLAENQLLKEQLKEAVNDLNFLKQSIAEGLDEVSKNTIRGKYQKILDKIVFLEGENQEERIARHKGHTLEFCNGVEYVLLTIRKCIEIAIEEEQYNAQCAALNEIVKLLEQRKENQVN